MLQTAKIERKTAEGKETSVAHHILTQKILRRIDAIQVPEGQKAQPFIEDLQNRVLEMGYKRLIEVSQTQTDVQFVQVIRLERSKTLN